MEVLIGLILATRIDRLPITSSIMPKKKKKKDGKEDSELEL